MASDQAQDAQSTTSFNVRRPSGEHHHSRKRKILRDESPDTDVTAADEELIAAQDRALRDFDREVRWLSFRYHSNRFFAATIRKHFGQDLVDTDSIFCRAKQKIIDMTKSHKNQMLKLFFRHMDTQKTAHPNSWALPDDEFRTGKYLSSQLLPCTY